MDRIKRGKKTKQWCIVASLLGIFLLYISIVKSDLLIPVNADEGMHLISSLRYYNVLVASSPGMFKQLLEVNSHYPPLFPLSSAILNIFFGTSRAVSVGTNMIYFLIMLFSTYFIGKKIGSRKTGLLACFVLSMFPMVFGMSRWFILEFPLTAMVSFSICCLFYTESFANRKYSLLFGLSVGLGMLTKWTFGIFMIGPFLCTILAKDRKSIKNLCYAIGLALFISFIWYLPHISGLIRSIPGGNIRIHEIAFPWYSLEGLLFYAKSILYQISPLFFFFFLIALPLTIRKKFKNKFIVFSWILFSYIILTIINNKWTHYIMPVLPAVALILAIGILAVPFRKLRYSLIGVLIIAGLVQFFYINYAGYQKMRKIVNYFPVKIDAQNMWRYVGKVPLEFYREIGRMYDDRIMPYFNKESLENEKLIVGIIATDFLTIHHLEYLILKNGWADIVEIVGFMRETEAFISLADRFDLLVINHSSKIWPDRYSIEEIFKWEKLDKIRRLTNMDYVRYSAVLKGLSKRFKIAETMKLPSDGLPFSWEYFPYLSVLTKIDKQQ